MAEPAPTCVTMIEANDEALTRGRENVAKNLDGYVSRGRMTEDAKLALGMI